MARHEGPLPKTVLVTIWREIISAMTALEGPYAVAVYAGNASRDGLPALARVHYGAERPISAHETILGVSLNKDSFRRRMLASGELEPTGQRQTNVGHRPAALYRRPDPG